MIEELNQFFRACIERYGRGDFITKITITDEAAHFIPHVAPKPGESIDILFVSGRVTIENGGDRANEIL